MKVLLINPPRCNEIVANNPVIIEEERGISPPLGILYIASVLRERSSHDVRVLDCQAEAFGFEELRARISDFGPDVAGITAMTMTLVDVLRTATIVKSASPSSLVVVGGAHATIFPEETARLDPVDFAVVGEGEVAFAALLDALSAGDRPRLSTIRGLAFRQDGVVVNTGMAERIRDLDALPFPSRDMVPYWRYSSLLATRQPVTTVFTSRGCPYRCSFCDRPAMGKIFRARSAGNVVDEIEECVRWGIHELLFYDDTFTVDRRRVHEICAELRRRRLDVCWDIRTRVDAVNEEMLDSLAAAGCGRIHYGVESGSERVLKTLRKKIRLDLVRQVFAATKKRGISVLAYFMLGCPSETMDEALASIRLAMELDPDYAHFTIFTPFPATELYLDGLSSGRIARDYWREFAASPSAGFVAPHWPGDFSRAELEQIIVRAYRDFYTRPSYIVTRLLRVRSAGELYRKVRAGLKVLAMRS